jgi:plastocyanin
MNDLAAGCVTLIVRWPFVDWSKNFIMKRTLKAVVGALLVVGMGSAQAADILGKVSLKGTPPAEKDLPLDPACGKLWPNQKPKTRFYAVGADNGLADVFVYLKQAPAQAPSTKPALLDQKGCEYSPYILGLQVGQKLLVRNSDPVLHNVHATPKVNKEFNLAQMAGGKDIERSFDQSEVMVRFKCDVHPWMFAYVGVVPHPYFAVTDKDGNFKIEGVPAGKYSLVSFHRKTHVTDDKATVQEIEVKDAAVTANFTVEVPVP